MARPKAKIDWLKVDVYLRAQCDGAAIARIIGIHPETLYDACKEKYKMGFSEYAAAKKSEGCEILRAKQYQAAMDGDKTMLIWLGKQYLGQSDKQTLEHDLEQKLPFIVEVVRRSEDPETENKTQ